jgi:hypothetical protein
MFPSWLLTVLVSRTKGELPLIAQHALSLSQSAAVVGAFDVQANSDLITRYACSPEDSDDEDVFLSNGQRLNRIERYLDALEKGYKRLAPLLKGFYTEE